MPTIRTALGVIGFVGLLAWPVLSFVVWVFNDWKPGGAQGGLSLCQGWFCALCLVTVSAYYVAVSAGEWSRTLFRLGVVLHVALFVAVITLISFTDGGFVILPVIFVGSVLWMLYANRIGKSKIAA
jgi:hypothetical protein